MNTDEVYSRKKGKIATSDAVMIRCKMWKQRGSVLKSCDFIARTRIRIEQAEFVGVVKNF